MRACERDTGRSAGTEVSEPNVRALPHELILGHTEGPVPN